MKNIFKISALIIFVLIAVVSGAKNDSRVFTDISQVQRLLKAIDVHLGAMNDIFQRNRVIALKASNCVYTQTDLKNMDMEFQELVQELIRIRSSAWYLGMFLFNDSSSKWHFEIKVKLKNGSVLAFAMPRFTPEDLGLYTWDWKESKKGFHVMELHNSIRAVGSIDKGIDTVSRERSRIAAFVKRLHIVARTNAIK